MHVLILNQTFYPDVAATAQHMWGLAQHLDRSGHRVTAICSQTIYGTDQKHRNGRERIGNIHIRRVAGTAFGKKSLPGRMSDFLSFYAAAFWEMQHVPRPDVVLALTSPPMISVLGMLQRQFASSAKGRRVRLVSHIMDLYPDAAVAMDVLREDSISRRIMARLTKRTLECSDAVIVLGRDMAERVEREYAVHRNRTHVIRPWADGRDLRPIPKCENPMARSLGLNQTFNIVYSGNLGMAHDVETMVAAMEMMRQDEGVEWVFIGGGSRFDELERLSREKNWKHVRFLPYQEREVLCESLNLADVHLVSQLPAFTGIVVPSKLFGIMAVGKPSVMVGPAEAECSRIIQEAECGFVVHNGNAAGLVEALRNLRSSSRLCREMGNRARREFEWKYDERIACAMIERVLAQVAT